MGPFWLPAHAWPPCFAARAAEAAHCDSNLPTPDFTMPCSVSRWLSAALPALFVASVAAANFSADDLPLALKTLHSVGPEGKGNAEAAAAWQQVSHADAARLPTILASLDDANPLAANWIRAAVDAIAQRQVRAGGKLPAADLEAFALDVRHSPRARRLAFDWLTQADRTAPDRLIPRMLDDPSVEFRRDAVARLMNEAAALNGGKSDATKGPARELYQKALSAARDFDQVQAIVKVLEAAGQKVDLHAHFGLIARWKLIGPFDNTDEKGFDVAYPPEKQVDFTATYPGKNGPVKWIAHETADAYGKVDMNAALGKANGVIGYAAAEFVAADGRPAELRITSVNANKVWLNGKLLAQNKIYHAGATFDQYIARGTLKPGKNLILVKVCQNEMKETWAQDWEFQFRVCDKVGTAILSQDRAAALDSPAPRKQGG
jgi:hypothetical protein